jgi:sugar lactone lactonase YvrE
MQSIFYRVLIFITFILTAAGAFAQTRVIIPVAGNGTAGFSGDGGPATAAELSDPAAVGTGPSGSLYIADRNNNRIRKVDASGVITTVAGDGIAGWFFESGPALNASLDRPSGVALDKNGNLYIVEFLETGVSRIHHVDTAGIISPVPIPEVLNGAVAISVDSSGQLYIAEQDGHRIRKVDPTSGAITTIAGTGTAGFSGDGGPATAAQLDHPVHLAFDAGGNLYFADSGNNRIRKIAAGSGTITTVAGNGAPGFAGDGGPATSAQLNQPKGVDVDSAGDILIADTLNQRIRRVSGKTGIMTTIVSGDGCAAITAALQAPNDVTVDASGHFLYIVDETGNRIWQITLDIDSPPPTLTSISPAGGPLGATVPVTLSGSGFFGSGGANAGSAACSLNGTTVFVSGSGVTVSNVSATSDTSLSAAFNIAANATPGARDVTVTTDSGTSGSVKFTIQVPVAPAPTLTSITPPTEVRGTTATLTLTGTNFVPGATSVAADGSGISFTNVSVTSTTSLTATLNVSAGANLGGHNVRVSTAGGGSNAMVLTIQPQGISFVYQMPQMLNPTDNTPIQVSLSSASADQVTGTLNLTFNSNAAVPADDPNVTFVNAQTSSRTATVTFPANTSTAQLSLPDGLLQAGTVAGMIQLSITDVQVGGTSVAPSDSGFNVQVPLLPPVITGVRIINKTSAGFDVEITGYSTSREITGATFDFGAASGQKLLTVELQPDVTSTFVTYYQSPPSDPAGGAFVYTQPFVIKQGTVKAVASVTVTLANSQGSSNSLSAQ